MHILTRLYNKLFYPREGAPAWKCMLAAAILAVTIGLAFWQYPEPAEQVPAVLPQRILIAYYSQGGHTQAVAETIQHMTGGDLYRIQTDIAYPRSAPAMQSQAKAEYNERLRPRLLSPLPDLTQYDVVFLGFPNWYNAPPAGVFTFLEQLSWQGKTIVPFVTYGLSGWGSSIEDIRGAAPDAVMARGLAVHASQAGHAQQAAAAWIDALGIDRKGGGEL